LNQSITQQILILQTNLRQANETLERRVQERTAELEVAYKKLSELSQLKANFVSNISHELRTPLTRISGYVDLLLSGGLNPLTTEQKEAVEVIKRASVRLERLIDNLILFSTSETNKLVINKEPTEPKLIAKNVFERYIEAARKKNISLVTQFSENLPIIQIDREKITWVYAQLVDNAIKFTQSGGKVTLRVQEKLDSVNFEVTDTGIGIKPQQIKEIFELFHQLDESSTRAQGGTGLGLALAKNIIDAHNSKINVSSIPGQGSTFSFLLAKS
jgi:signal transduction histidine kinase